MMNDLVRKLHKLLERVEYVDAGGDLYCPFCGASPFASVTHKDGCEWVAAMAEVGREESRNDE